MRSRWGEVRSQFGTTRPGSLSRVGCDREDARRWPSCALCLRMGGESEDPRSHHPSAEIRDKASTCEDPHSPRAQNDSILMRGYRTSKTARGASGELCYMHPLAWNTAESTGVALPWSESLTEPPIVMPAASQSLVVRSDGMGSAPD